jgi:glycosyltransferase involved in cell wall biosynthesis
MFDGVDYYQMSGGCHFTGDCQRYTIGCGKCPAISSNSMNDFTSHNVKFRKRVYDKVNPVVFGNQYMCDFYNKSYLLRDVRCEVTDSVIINTDIFRPIDKTNLRHKYQIPELKKYIVFFGCQALNDERKGIIYLLEAFNYLFELLGNRANEVLIITAGKQFDEIKEKIPFESKGFGYVKMNDLPELFSMSTMFVCPSVNDAGPMMVNQSLCCGTPVVGFDMGAVKQVVKDRGTGICVPIRDSKALAEGMYNIIHMSAKDYQQMSYKAREVALKTSSYEAQADRIISIYKKYRD